MTTMKTLFALLLGITPLFAHAQTGCGNPGLRLACETKYVIGAENPNASEPRTVAGPRLEAIQALERPSDDDPQTCQAHLSLNDTLTGLTLSATLDEGNTLFLSLVQNSKFINPQFSARAQLGSSYSLYYWADKRVLLNGKTVQLVSAEYTCSLKN